MSSPIANPASRGRPGYWAALLFVGLLATTAGVLAPQLVPGASEMAVHQGSPQASPNASLGYTPPAWPEPPSVRGLLTRLAIGTMVVLGLSVATLWYGRRWLQAPTAAATGRELRLVETLHLGNRCCLHLVQLASRQVLVGADAGGIRSVVTMNEGFEPYLQEAAQEQPAPNQVS